MKLSITKKIGWRDYTFEVEGENLYEVITESQKLGFRDLKGCGICQSENLYLEAHEATKDNKTFKYCSVKCADCGASLTFGRRTDDPNVFFYRRTEDKALDWKEKKEAE